MQSKSDVEFQRRIEAENLFQNKFQIELKFILDWNVFIVDDFSRRRFRIEEIGHADCCYRRSGNDLRVYVAI